MSRTVLILLTIVILLLVLYLGINYSFNSRISLPVIQSFSINPTPVPQMSLALDPEEMYVSPGSSNHVDVVLDTKNADASIIQLEISYNPAALSNISILPGSYFMSSNVLLNNVDTKNGRISYAIAPADNQKPNKNSHVVAIINFTANQLLNTTTQFTFLPKTAIQRKGVKIVLDNVRGTTIKIASGSAQPASPTSAFYIPIFNKK